MNYTLSKDSNIRQQAQKNLITEIRNLPLGVSFDISIKETKSDKTIKQLGGLFANWIKYISEVEGESEDYKHKELKAKFLARIYIAEPMGDQQEQWVELLALYQMQGDQEKLLKHARRISLSWAKLPQMKQYMNAIEQHYQSMGIGLPPMKNDDYQKWKRYA